MFSLTVAHLALAGVALDLARQVLAAFGEIPPPPDPRLEDRLREVLHVEFDTYRENR